METILSAGCAHCPVCNGSKIKSRMVVKQVSDPLGPPHDYEAEEDTCLMCGEVGDFNAVNGDALRAALFESGCDFVQSAIQEMGEQGIAAVSIDRICRLKIGTAGKWQKRQDITPEAIALMRFLRTLPWLLDVADEDFTYDAVAAAAQSFYEHTR